MIQQLHFASFANDNVLHNEKKFIDICFPLHLKVFERLGPVSFLAIAFCACFMALMIFILLRSAEKSDTGRLMIALFIKLLNASLGEKNSNC